MSELYIYELPRIRKEKIEEFTELVERNRGDYDTGTSEERDRMSGIDLLLSDIIIEKSGEIDTEGSNGFDINIIALVSFLKNYADDGEYILFEEDCDKSKIYFYNNKYYKIMDIFSNKNGITDLLISKIEPNYSDYSEYKKEQLRSYFLHGINSILDLADGSYFNSKVGREEDNEDNF